MPFLTIGSEEGGPEYGFFGIRAAFRLSDGTTVVADAATSELRFFDTSGRWVRTEGGRGVGPGEFEYLYTASAIQGDTVFAWDHVQRRVTLFPPDGARPTTFRASLEGRTVEFAGQPSSVVAERAVATRTGDIWVVPATPRYLLRGVEPGIYRFHPPLFRIGRSGQVEAQTRSVAGDPYAVSGRFHQPWRFGGWLDVDAGVERVVAGVGTNPAVEVVDTDGSTRTVAVEYLPAPPVTEELWTEAARQSLRAFATSAHDEMLRYYQDIERPSVVPHYSAVVVDDEDRVWLGAFQPFFDWYSHSGRRWDVFSMDGEVVGAVTLPRSLVVTDVRDGYLTGVEKDELDVERVVIYRVGEAFP